MGRMTSHIYPYMKWKHNPNVPNHQPDIFISYIYYGKSQPEMEVLFQTTNQKRPIRIVDQSHSGQNGTRNQGPGLVEWIYVPGLVNINKKTWKNSPCY